MASKFVTNFVGGTSKSQWAKLGCGYTQNMYLETKDTNEHYHNRVLLPFPGQKELYSVTGTPRGMFTAIGGYDGETAYFAAGTSVYCISSDGPIKVADVGSGRVDFAEIRTADKNFLIFSDGSMLQAIDMTVVPALQKSVVVPLPKRVNADGTYGDSIHPTSVCVCYNMVNVVDDGTDKFYTSVTMPFKYDGTAVDYDIFAVNSAPINGEERPYYQVGYYTYGETSADPIVRLVSDGKALYAIGKNSFDRYTYTGVAITNSVLAGVVWKSPKGEGGFYGTNDPDSVKAFGGSVYYVARNPNGGRSIVRLGASIELVSTPDIDAILGKVLSSTVFQWGQHPFYVVRMDNTTLCYDVREAAWVNLESNGKTWDIVNTTPLNNTILIQYNGGVGCFTTDKWTDHANKPIVRRRSGSIVSSNMDEFLLSQVSVITNSGQYGVTGKDYKAIFRWTADGVTWEDTGVETLGRVGQYERVLDVYDLGEGRNFGIEISCSEDIPFCIYGIKIDASICDL